MHAYCIDNEIHTISGGKAKFCTEELQKKIDEYKEIGSDVKL